MNDPSVSSSPATPPEPTPGSNGPPHRRWLLGVGGLLLVAAVVVALLVRSGLWRTKAPSSPPAAADPFPSLPLAPSSFLNTRPDAHYVGSATCRRCHEDRHRSFRGTGMGCSMAEVDAGREPPDGAFDHPSSKRRYQVRRKDGQLWHRELLLTGQPQEVVLCEHPVKYVVGSGHHSRTYLVEVDGFLMESPITWFTSRKAWGMSPGYDTPRHMGFQRPIGEGCLICHAGQAEALEGSVHRMRVTEAAIGCERCHGPGSLHVERHDNKEKAAARRAGEVDYTIVNPVHLPRELAEAVCQQCHLQSRAVILSRGRTFADFRPGLPLQDFRQDYMLQTADKAMTVVGHVEQMHRSRCYQGSDRLSCLTCHDPHDEPRPADRTAYYRSVCLNCHRPERCTVDARRRRQESPDNDCAHCHMPRSPTEDPHLAFTHHRIGIHDRQAAESGRHVGNVPHGQGGEELRPFLDLSRLSEVDRQRSLGLGYLETANQEPDAARRVRFQQQALELLSGARAAGLRDPVLDAGLARLHADLGLGDDLLYAERALAHPDLRGQDRCNALFLLANAQVRQKRFEDALTALRELTRLRRHPVDWMLRGACEKELGHPAAADEALRTAARINPRAWRIHQYLADHYRLQGDAERAAWHQQRAVP